MRYPRLIGIMSDDSQERFRKVLHRPVHRFSFRVGRAEPVRPARPPAPGQARASAGRVRRRPGPAPRRADGSPGRWPATVWSSRALSSLSRSAAATPRADSAASIRVATRSSSPARSPETTSATQRSSTARSCRSPRVPTTQSVRTTPTAAQAITPATVHCGARSANSRLSVNATPRPKPAPSSVISRVSARRDRSGGAGTSTGRTSGAGHSTGRPSSVLTSLQLARHCHVDLRGDLTEPPPHMVRERARTFVAWSTPRPPAVRPAPRCSGYARSRTAAPAPAASGCAPRWHARSCRAAPAALRRQRCSRSAAKRASRPAPHTSRS